MNDKTLEFLNALAAKLGTTAEHLWAVLTKQAKFAAISDFILSAILVSAFILAARTTYVNTRTPDATPDNEYPRPKWDDEIGVSLAVVCTCALGLFAAISVCSAVGSALTAVFNPEYFALNQMLRK